jgi:hypothetical protein
LDSHKGSRWELGLYNGALGGGKLPQVQNATTGAEARANLEAQRRAKAPLFHGITRIREFFGIPALVNFSVLRAFVRFSATSGSRAIPEIIFEATFSLNT